MLEWVTAAQAKFSLPLDVRGFYRRMAGGVALAAAAAVIVAMRRARGLADRGSIRDPVDAVAGRRAVGEPSAARGGPQAGLRRGRARTAADRTPHLALLRDLRHGGGSHAPSRQLSGRPEAGGGPSDVPTNLGLYLLSVVAARDFGWLGMLETVERLEATLATMNGLERFRGHFYNWYDTRDLRPLDPKYVSSVDSGNLAGHLIALGNACREMIDRPVVGPEWLAGIADALGLTRESLRALADDRRTQTVTRKQLDEALDALAASLRARLRRRRRALPGGWRSSRSTPTPSPTSREP